MTFEEDDGRWPRFLAEEEGRLRRFYGKKLMAMRARQARSGRGFAAMHISRIIAHHQVWMCAYLRHGLTERAEAIGRELEPLREALRVYEEAKR